MDWDEIKITVVDPDTHIMTEDEIIYSLPTEQEIVYFV